MRIRPFGLIVAVSLAVSPVFDARRDRAKNRTLGLDFQEAEMATISFDLDDTLVPHGVPPTAKSVDSAPFFMPWFLRYWFPEPLRAGTGELLRALAARGHEVWIYTTSPRGSLYLWLWFGWYGIRLAGIVNHQRHQRMTQDRGWHGAPSKYPPAFGIDLHVDDSQGVVEEGFRWSFRVLRVDRNDGGWIQKVLAAVDHLPTLDGQE